MPRHDSTRFTLRRLGVAILLGALASGSFSLQTATGSAGFPRHLDPRSWEVPENMTWADYKPIPGVDWEDPKNQPPRKLRAALILGDFADQKFRVAETSVDPSGQRGLGVDDPAQFWLDYLFDKEDPKFYNHGFTVNDYWLENSYGLIGVEAEAFGPYRLAGNMFEYGLSDFAGAEDCPAGYTCNRNFDTELAQASLVDVTMAIDERGSFDFRFLLHAGYDESGAWLNFGQMLFPTKESVTSEYGAPVKHTRNWAPTRYVDWTSFFAAQQIWSHALPGALSTQGESDGGSTYAHELSHILGVLDNYNNPYADAPKRAYSGPWDMMSRGTFNGPGGPWDRWQIPPVKGGTMGSQHMIRNKVRMGFMPASEVRTLRREVLRGLGVVRTRILQRESPPATTDPTLDSGIRIVLGQDESSCDNSKPKCDGGRYDFYDVEVVNRQGFDSFLPDHGVLIAKTKAADAAPFIWVIDAFPRDIGLVDYVRADGKKFFYTVGDYRQLADAAFHAGTAPGTRNSYADAANGLAFFILNKEVVDGRLVYDLAVASLDRATPPGEAEVEKVSGRLVVGTVTKNVFSVINSGTASGVYRLKLKLSGPIQARLLNDLVYLEAGESVEVPVWAKAMRTGARLNLKVAEAY